MSPEFLLTSFIVVISPGAGMIYTLVTTFACGFKAGVFAALGGTLSFISHVTAAILGLAALLHTSAVAFQLVKVAGVAYLLYMAYQLLSAKSALRTDALKPEAQTRRSALVIMRDGILLNLLNPKLSIFFLAFLPQFIDVNADNPVGEMVFLAGVYMAITFVVFVLIAAMAAQVRDRLLARPNVMKWLNRSFAATFVALGVRLALTE